MIYIACLFGLDYIYYYLITTTLIQIATMFIKLDDVQQVKSSHLIFDGI